jgi:membrane carboxypeptidase/penicillin-binding protein
MLMANDDWERIYVHIEQDVEKYRDRLQEIPYTLIVALVVAEDRRFFHHRGVDFKALIRACLRNIQALGFVEGASTIEQQLARTYTQKKEKTISRKWKDILLSVRMATEMDKDTIAKLYVSVKPAVPSSSSPLMR